MFLFAIFHLLHTSTGLIDIAQEDKTLLFTCVVANGMGLPLFGLLKGKKFYRIPVLFENSSAPVSMLLASSILFAQGGENYFMTIAFARLIILCIYFFLSVYFLNVIRDDALPRALNYAEIIPLSVSRILTYLSNNIDIAILSGISSIYLLGQYKLAKQIVELVNLGLPIITAKYGRTLRRVFTHYELLGMKRLFPKIHKELRLIGGIGLIGCLIAFIVAYFLANNRFDETLVITTLILMLIPIANMVFGPVVITYTMSNREGKVIFSNLLRIVVVFGAAFVTHNAMILTSIFAITFVISRWQLSRNLFK